MTLQNFQLTFSGAPLGADQLATLDAYRARTALGDGEPTCLDAAIGAYLAHHPGMTRADAAEAVARILFEARRALSARTKLDRMSFAPKKRTAPLPVRAAAR